MHDHIVVGHDGGGGGADALVLALALADAWSPDTKVTVAAIYPYDPGYRSASETFEQELRAQTEAHLTEARELCRDRPNVDFVLRRGSSPAEALQALASELDARAIVVGRSHTNALERAFLGSATEQTLHGAPCAVAVAPVGLADRGVDLSTIGVAYDGRPDAQHAADVAADLARRVNARLRVIRLLQPIPVWYGGAIDPYPLAVLQDDAKADIANLQERISGVEIDAQLVNGEATAALSEAEGVGLMVLGSRGFGPVQRVVLGSTSTKLARHTKLPLLIVPRVENEQDAA